MKKILFLTLLSGVMNIIGCNPSVNPPISGSYAPCSCSFSACYIDPSIFSPTDPRANLSNPRNIIAEGKLTNSYTYLKCSCPDKGLSVALPNTAISQGIGLTYNGSALQMTTPSSNAPITICQGYNGCSGYCSFANGVASCTWGSRAPISWLVTQSLPRD